MGSAPKKASKAPDALSRSFGQRVQTLREKAGLSFAEFGAAAGMGKGYLWRVERGEVLPSIRNAARIAQALELSLAELMEGVDISEIGPESRALGFR